MRKIPLSVWIILTRSCLELGLLGTAITNLREKQNMAKKPKAPPATSAPEETTLSKAKSAVVHAAEKVADVVVHAAESANDHVVKPVAEAVGIRKKKKVPAKRVKHKPMKPVPLPEPTTKAKGKMMSKNVPSAPEASDNRSAKATKKPK
jgi:hypothetical protein